MTQIGIQLSELKGALQELETAVQQPRDERCSIEQVLDKFPHVIMNFSTIIQSVLATYGIVVVHPHEAFTQAHNRGWLKGELSLWLRLLSNFQQLKEEDMHGAQARSVAQDVRACSCIFWQTYEVLLARFRGQTQVQPMPKAPAPAARFAFQQA